MVVTGFSKICFLSLCLSLIVLGTSAGISSTRVELFKKFFIAAQEFMTAAVAAGGIEKLKQDPKFKGISPQIIDVLLSAGKALEDLPNPDVAVRGFSLNMKNIKDKVKGAVQTGKNTWQKVKDVCGHIV